MNGFHSGVLLRKAAGSNAFVASVYVHARMKALCAALLLQCLGSLS